MTKQYEWLGLPLMGGGYNVKVPVGASDVATLRTLYPDCDPTDPPWEAIAAELEAVGYDRPYLTQIQYRRLIHMVRESRSNQIAEKRPTAETFVPNVFQRSILNALDGRAMKKQQLADKVAGGDGRRFYRPH